MYELITKSRKVTMKEETLKMLSRRDVIAKTSDLFGIGWCYSNKQVLRCCKTAKELWEDLFFLGKSGKIVILLFFFFFFCNTWELERKGAFVKSYESVFSSEAPEKSDLEWKDFRIPSGEKNKKRKTQSKLGILRSFHHWS